MADSDGIQQLQPPIADWAIGDEAQQIGLGAEEVAILEKLRETTANPLTFAGLRDGLDLEKGADGTSVGASCEEVCRTVDFTDVPPPVVSQPDPKTSKGGVMARIGFLDQDSLLVGIADPASTMARRGTVPIERPRLPRTGVLEDE
jgi:hypothetical protein